MHCYTFWRVLEGNPWQHHQSRLACKPSKSIRKKKTDSRNLRIGLLLVALAAEREGVTNPLTTWDSNWTKLDAIETHIYLYRFHIIYIHLYNLEQISNSKLVVPSLFFWTRTKVRQIVLASNKVSKIRFLRRRRIKTKRHKANFILYVSYFPCSGPHMRT